MSSNALRLPPPSTGRARGGFTAIEILVVVGILIMLIGLTVPGLMGSMRRGRVHDAANGLSRVTSQARQLARTRYPSPGGLSYYGVVIVNDETPAYAALTFGSTASKGNILLDASGKPVSKMLFNRNVIVYNGADPVSSELGWMYQFRTGYPITTASPSAPPIDIGVYGGFAPSGITIRTLDGQFKAGFAVYQIGVANVQDY